MPVEIPEPWVSFLREVDQTLSQPIKVHCLGGFVLYVMWRPPRVTGDVDFNYIDPSGANSELLRIAGEGSDLANRYHLKFQRVANADCPADYESRLIDITPGSFRRLRLLGFEVHDLVLAKLARGIKRDREDVAFLVKKGAIDRDLLEKRFEEEVRPYTLNEARHANNLKLCLDECFGAEGQ